MLEKIPGTSLLDPSLVDLHVFLWSILSVCGHSTKPLEDPHSSLYPPKDRVLVVKKWGRSKGEEELGTVGVGTRVGHCQYPRTRES